MPYSTALATTPGSMRKPPSPTTATAGVSGAAQLGRVDVDLDQPGRRDRVGIAGQPGAGGAVIEPGAEREDHVGAAGRAVGLVGAVAAGRAEVQRPLQLADALAERGGGDRD